MKTRLSERFQTVTGGEFGFYSSQLYFALSLAGVWETLCYLVNTANPPVWLNSEKSPLKGPTCDWFKGIARHRSRWKMVFFSVSESLVNTKNKELLCFHQFIIYLLYLHKQLRINITNLWGRQTPTGSRDKEEQRWSERGHEGHRCVGEGHTELLVRWSAHQKTFNKVGVAFLDFPEDFLSSVSQRKNVCRLTPWVFAWPARWPAGGSANRFASAIKLWLAIYCCNRWRVWTVICLCAVCFLTSRCCQILITGPLISYLMPNWFDCFLTIAPACFYWCSLLFA